MAETCGKCGKSFKSKSGKASHIRFSRSCGSAYQKTTSTRSRAKPKTSPKVGSNRAILNNSQAQGQSASTIMIAQNEPRNEEKQGLFKKEVEVPKEPTEDEFSSSWLDDYEESSESITNDSTTTDQNFFDSNESNESTELQNAFTLSAEQYKAFFIMLNDFLDTIISLAGGDEVYSLMKDATLDNLALSTKNYADSMNFELSPAKMLMASVALAYSVPTTRAFKSIRTNRARMRALNSIKPEKKLTKSELDELQKDVKIDFMEDFEQ